MEDVFKAVGARYAVVAELGETYELFSQRVTSCDAVEGAGETQGGRIVKQKRGVFRVEADHVEHVVVVVATAVVRVPGVVARQVSKVGQGNLEHRESGIGFI